THDGLVNGTDVGAGTPIEGFVHAYLERATAYDATAALPATCLPPATGAFSSATPVGPSCPRADLLGPAIPCVEAPVPGPIDPSSLRCGPRVDDLAVGLSGAAPSGVWLTRQSMVIRDGSHGSEWALLFGDSTPVIPLHTAAFVDVSHCAPSIPPDNGST